MKKKFKGFSLAELLIALLVISIVLSAAIPTITKRSAGGEQIWRWSREQDHNYSNSAYFGVGATQSAIIGATNIPSISNPLATASGEEMANVKFSHSGDKLVLIKQTTRAPGDESIDSNMINSHISFFTLRNADDATTNDIHYAGRLSLDSHNIALGIGSLQSMDNLTDTFKGYNTAIGHVALLNNKSGQYNTAVGEKALAEVRDGSANTALGYFAGSGIDQPYEFLDDDTKNSISNYNTAIGAYAMAGGAGGNRTSKVSGTTAVGAHSCSNLTVGDNNICIGYRSNPVDTIDKSAPYGLYIGSYQAEGATSNQIDVPLISGRTQAVEEENFPIIPADRADLRDRRLDINTRYFKVRSFDGIKDMFAMKIDSGSDASPYIALADTTYGNYIFHTYRNSSSDKGADIGLELTQGSNIDNGNVDPYGINLNAFLNKNSSFQFYTPSNFVLTTHDTLNTIKIASDINSTIHLENSGLTYLYNITKIDEPNDNYTAKLILNENIDFSTSTGTSTLKIKPKEVHIASHSPNLDDDMYLRLDENNTSIKGGGNLYVESDAILITNSTITSKDANNDVFMFKGSTNKTIELNTTSGDIKLPAIKIQTHNESQMVASHINTLWGKIIDLEQRMTTPSDIRLKENISDNTAGLKEINALEVKNYTYKKDEKKTPHVGVIAQQLQKIFPNSVIKDEDGYLKIRTEEIFYAMVNSIKELFAQVQDLTAKIVGLDKRLVELEKENKELKKQNAEFEKRLQRLEASLKK